MGCVVEGGRIERTCRGAKGEGIGSGGGVDEGSEGHGEGVTAQYAGEAAVVWLFKTTGNELTVLSWITEFRLLMDDT